MGQNELNLPSEESEPREYGFVPGPDGSDDPDSDQAELDFVAERGSN